MQQTRSDTLPTLCDSLPHDPACVLCKHIDSWCSIFVTMKVQETFTVGRHVMLAEFLGHSHSCLEKDELFPYLLKAEFIFLCQQPSVWSSVPQFPLLLYFPEQSKQHYKDAGEDAELAQWSLCLGPSLPVMSAFLPPLGPNACWPEQLSQPWGKWSSPNFTWN